ncbi:MAG: glycoside hydrolase family 9 protein, partial [Oscillospiraceae bacterium]
MGISYITGTGEQSPLRPAHALSVSTLAKPVPGMVVCGANSERDDDFSKWRLSGKTPPAKCYIDNECSFSTNAPSVAFTASALLAAAFFDCSGLSSDDISLTN